MIENIRAIADLARDREREGLPLHPALAVPGWAAQYLEVEDDDQELCDWCGLPCNDNYPGETCSGHDGPIHGTNQFGEHCHLDSECRRSE